MPQTDRLRITLAVVMASLGMSGCIESGSSGSFLTDDNMRYKISGTLSSTANLVVDSDVNDLNASFASNDILADAQPLVNLVTVQGFASASPTQGRLSEAPATERFANSTDPKDYFSAKLLAGQLLSLAVANTDEQDSERYAGDLDLYLLDDKGDVVQSSTGQNSSEKITVPKDGDYYILVQATSGISKYVLQLFPSTGQTASRQGEFVDDQILIGFEPGVSAASFNMSNASGNASIQTASIQSSGPVGPTLIEVRHLSSANLPTDEGNHHRKIQTLQAIKDMAKQPGVRYAEPNYIRQPLLQPNDPLFSSQWHYGQIDLPQAWDLTQGARSDDSHVVVAVIDTGVFMAHTDLAGQLTSDGYDFISNTNNAGDGDGIDANPDDSGDGFQLAASSWHGTHVAGTIAARTDNNLGVAGVSWHAKVMPVRVLGKSGGTSFDIIQGMLYAAGLANASNTVPEQKADIINMSLGGFSSSVAEADAVAQVRNAGVVIVAAAGNESVSFPAYPAAYPGVISVSATDVDNELARYSNTGSTIDVAAPGGDNSADLNNDGSPDGVLSTLVEVQGTSRLSGYQSYQGTSMATPHVAGVLALMKAVNPDLTPAQIDQLLSQGDLTDDLGTAGRDDQFGHGLINAYKAVQAAATAGDIVIDVPVILNATPSTLEIGSATTFDFRIDNLGQGSPQLNTPTVNASWASVSAVNVDNQGLGTYRLTVDRTGLIDGFHNAVVEVTGKDGEKDIGLSLAAYIKVGEFSTTGHLTTQYVLAIDANTQDVIESVAASSDGRYTLTVPEGEYLVIAGSDTDVDQIVCDKAETCGGYPSFNRPSSISVSRSQSGIDFSVNIIGGSTPFRLPAQQDGESEQQNGGNLLLKRTATTVQ